MNRSVNPKGELMKPLHLPILLLALLLLAGCTSAAGTSGTNTPSLPFGGMPSQITLPWLDAFEIKQR